MIKAIFFDLDGTLLPLDMDEFINKYFAFLTAEFSDLEEPEILIKKLMAATKDMINNDGSRTNQDVFINSFFEKVEVEDHWQVLSRFDRFYREEFPRLQAELSVEANAKELIADLQADYQLILATNPLFPRVAIVERMKWAGLAVDDFDYITCYEEMHYCKPDLNFFRELLHKLQLQGEQCIMVGNDLQEDMVATELDFTTYLVEDYLIDRGSPGYRVDWRGSLSELKEALT